MFTYFGGPGRVPMDGCFWCYGPPSPMTKKQDLVLLLEGRSVSLGQGFDVRSEGSPGPKHQIAKTTCHEMAQDPAVFRLRSVLLSV